jgi:hypothetical protein
MEDIITDEEKIAAYEDIIMRQVDYLEKNADYIVKMESHVRTRTLHHLAEHPDDKKMSWEKLEAFASLKTDDSRLQYGVVCDLRLRQKMAEKMIEATESALSGRQSLMRYKRENDGGRI